MTVLTPAVWWRGPFAYQVAILSLVAVMVIGVLIVRHMPERTPPSPGEVPR